MNRTPTCMHGGLGGDYIKGVEPIGIDKANTRSLLRFVRSN